MKHINLYISTSTSRYLHYIRAPGSFALLGDLLVAGLPEVTLLHHVGDNLQLDGENVAMCRKNSGKWWETTLWMGFFDVAMVNKWFLVITLWCHQLHGSGKSPMVWGFLAGKITDFYGPFSCTPCVSTTQSELLPGEPEIRLQEKLQQWRGPLRTDLEKNPGEPAGKRRI